MALRAKTDRSGARFERVYRLRGDGRLDPLICFPPGIGLGWGYAGLRRVVNRERPIYCLQALGLTDGDRLPPTVDALVDDYLALVRGLQPSGPYNFLGWSFGGIVAHTAACRLQADGAAVTLVAVLDAYPTPRRDAETPTTPPTPADLSQVLPAAIARELPSDDLRRVRALVDHAYALLAEYEPPRLDGDLMLFTAAGHGQYSHAWNRYVSGQVHRYDVDCNHLEMSGHAALATVGAEIERRLGAGTAGAIRGSEP